MTLLFISYYSTCTEILPRRANGVSVGQDYQGTLVRMCEVQHVFVAITYYLHVHYKMLIIIIAGILCVVILLLKLF